MIMRDDANCRELYLELLKDTLTGLIYDDDCLKPNRGSRLLGRTRFAVRQRAGVRQARIEGREWPVKAHTMVGRMRLDSMQRCIEDVVANQVPGDFIETGVWRGGVTIFMRAMLKMLGVRDRVVWAADSFRGLPPPDATRYPADRRLHLSSFSYLAVSLDEVRANLARYGMLDEGVRFLPGWFEETLPTAPLDRLAIVRLDGDLYGSTMDALRHLYPRLSAGGYLIVDDYGVIPACRQAVTDFRQAHGIQEPIQDIDGSGVYWRRASG